MTFSDSEQWDADDKILTAFESAWRSEPFPDLNDFLSEECSDALREELVILDLENRWRRGHRTLLEHYSRFFDNLSPDQFASSDLLSAELEIRAKHDEFPTPSELEVRFPNRWQEALSLCRSLELASSRPAKHPGLEIELDTRYELQEELGRGVFSIVQKAWDSKLERFVALKIPKPDWSSTPDFRHRFLREAQAVADLRHPSIVGVIEILESTPPRRLSASL